MPLNPEQLLTVTRAWQPLPLPDGSLVFASDMAGWPQTYRLESPGAWPRRLTSGLDRTLPVEMTPAGLLLRQDHGGNEIWQLSLLQPDGSLRPLTTDQRAIHRSPRLSPDGRRIGLARNPGGQDDFVLSVLDVDSGEIRDVASPGGSMTWSGWRPDGRQAAAIRTLGGRASQAYLADLGSGTLTPILPDAYSVSDVSWTADGRLLALTSFDSDFVGLAEIDGASVRWLLREDHDVHAYAVSPAASSIAVAVNEGPYDSLRMLGGDRLELPRGVLYSDNTSEDAAQLAWAGEHLLVAWETPTQPADVLTKDTRWTFAAPELPSMVQPQEVSFRSFDGLDIPALLFGQGSRPTVVYIHGGPESQFRGSFNQVVQLLVAGGLNVLAPNVRGSSGYGIRYLSLDNRERRWDSVRDACEAARWLKQTGRASKVAAMGGSYGGFMTLAVLVEAPDLWDAGVDVVGIADWHTFFKNTSGWRRATRTSEYGDPLVEPDATFLAEFSPIRRAERIRCPLLVIHGRNDPRVPVAESEQIARVTGAELLVFDDEGHGLVKHPNRVRGYTRALEFLRQHLASG